MGRLEDIAKRNKQAGAGDNLIIKAGGAIASGDKPAKPDIPGMRRSTTTSPLIVIPCMYTCRNTGRKTYEQRMMGEQK